MICGGVVGVDTTVVALCQRFQVEQQLSRLSRDCRAQACAPQAPRGEPNMEQMKHWCVGMVVVVWLVMLVCHFFSKCLFLLIFWKMDWHFFHGLSMFVDVYRWFIHFWHTKGPCDIGCRPWRLSTRRGSGWCKPWPSQHREKNKRHFWNSPAKEFQRSNQLLFGVYDIYIYMGYLFIENHRLTMMHSKAVLLLEGLEQIQQTNLRSCPQGPTQYCVVDHCYWQGIGMTSILF